MPLADGSVGNTSGNSINGRNRKDERRADALKRLEKFSKLSTEEKLASLPIDGAKRQKARYVALLEKEKEKEKKENEVKEIFVNSGPNSISLIIINAKLAASRSEAIRKIKEGAVSVDGVKVEDETKEIVVDKSIMLKVGRKKIRINSKK